MVIASSFNLDIFPKTINKEIKSNKNEITIYSKKK